MPTFDLRQFVIQSSGSWAASADRKSADLLILDSAGDAVSLSGPLTIHVVLQSVNQTATLTNSMTGSQLHYHDLYSYNLAIPAGQVWQYGIANENFQLSPGTNRGYRVLVRVGYAAPAVPISSTSDDLPCGFAVGSIRNVSEFFPSPCEPCSPGMPISLPPGGSPTLSPPAVGGCIRPRYFNGMFVSREDLESEQRYFRLKNKMQNRAMGAGVVWGLGVSRTSSGVCVTPGYGVDCCGNDIIITEGYHVATDLLLADPSSFQFLISANQKKRFLNDDCGERPTPPTDPGNPDGAPCRRMHLLLEYVECPRDPRPVHGDPCNPTATSCEMSRIRETARLRLVPPRDYDPKGPIDRFLDVVKDIAQQNGIDISGATGAGSSATMTSTPFQVRITAGAANQPLFPPAGLDTTVTMPVNGSPATVNLPGITPTTAPFGFTLRTPTIAGYQLFAGQLRDNQTNTIRATVSTSGQSTVDWGESPVPTAWNPGGPDPTVRTWSYTLENFEARPNPPNASLPTIRGSATISVEVTYARAANSNPWRITASATLAAVDTARPFPCLDEACSCGDGPPRFPVAPPFLHADPFHPGQAADWKVVAFAALYAWLAGETAANQSGAGGQTTSARLALLRALYLILANLLFHVQSRSDLERVTRAIRCLLEAWCKTLLYPGPKCDEGIHGVVIGCASIRGGRIVDVDPWGGRRWVVHYPLLAHWGHQFGIVPLDVMASRVFGLLCCLAHLPLPFADRGTTDPVGGVNVPGVPATGNITGGIAALGDAFSFMRAAAAGQTAASPAIGSVRFFTRSGAGLQEDLKNAGIQPAGTRELPMPEFIAELLVRIRTDAGANAPFVLYKLKGSENVFFAAPVPYEPAKTSRISGDRLTTLTRASQPEARTAVPTLLRNTADELTANVLARIPLTKVQPGETSDRLTAAGIADVATLLSSDPDAAFAASGSTDPKEFSALVERSEATASTVAKAVFTTTGAVAREASVFTKQGAANPETLRPLRSRLTESLSKTADVGDLKNEVSAAIEETFGVAPGEDTGGGSGDTKPPDKPDAPIRKSGRK